VGKQFGQASRLAAVIIVAAAFGCGNAVAVEFVDIAGKWCTTGGSEEFERDNLIAVPTASRERRVYPIVSYKFGDTQVTVIWKNAKGENVSTDFAEFSSGGRRMVQLPFEGGPRREFRRC
jgi:hypothetical protein